MSQLEPTIKLIDVSPDLVVYRRFKYRYLKKYISERKMEFTKVASWEVTDSFENLFNRLSLRSKDNSIVLAVSDACDTLYGQSWTVDSERVGQWEHFSRKGSSLGDTLVMVKTTVKDLGILIDDSFSYKGYRCTFNDRVIGKVCYKTEDEIVNWLTSLSVFPIEQVQDLSICYALMKRQSNSSGTDYTIEDEVRCLAWGGEKNSEVIRFAFDPRIFTKYVIDPHASDSDRESIKKELISLGLCPTLIQ